MPDLPTRLIEAAVRPLADNAEMQLSASRLLETQISPSLSQGESAIRHWHQLDSRRRKPVIRIALFSILALASAAVLTASIRQVIGYQKVASWFFGEDFYGDFPNPEELIGQNLTRDQKLLLFGDSTASSRDLRAKALWDSEPDNPAYFAEYVTAFQREFGELPADFLETARRLDPDNAWFTYVAASALARGTHKQNGSAWEITDPAKLAAAMALVHEARTQPRCDNYQDLMLRKRIPLLPQDDLLENLNSIFAINTVSTNNNIHVVMLSGAIQANGWQLAENGDSPAFRELLVDWALLMRRLLDMKNPTLLDTVIVGGAATLATTYLSPSAEKLGLTAEAEPIKSTRQRLFERSRSAKTAELLIAGRPPAETSGTFAGSHLADTKLVASYPPLSDVDVKPGRLTEHEIISQLGSIVTWALLLVALIAVAIYRFRSPALIHRLAARMASSLRPPDWAWILIAGIILPFCYVMLITRLTPLGGRHFSLTKNDLKFFPDTVIPLPLAQFLGLAILLIVAPLLISRWRLAIRAAAFGFTNRRPWLGFAAFGCATAFIPVIGSLISTGEKSHIHLAFGLLALPTLWLLVVAFRSLLGGPAQLLHASSTALVLIPIYAAAMLLMISVVPVFKAAECYWLKQDKLMRFDPAFPALFRYEYEISQQAQRELSQAMSGVSTTK